MSRIPAQYKNIIRLALPIILANASAPLLGLADTAAIGQTGSAEDLGGIALATLVFSFVYWGFGFLRMGTTGFVAQAWGAKNREDVLSILYRSLLLALFIGLVLIILQIFIIKLATFWMSAEDSVIDLVKDYFYIRIWGAPATLMTYAILGTFIGLGKTRELMWVQLLLNGLNISLNILFVVVFHMGVKGIAWGTVLSEYTALFFAWFILAKILPIKNIKQQIKELWSSIIEKTKVISMFQVNRDIMIRTFALLAGFAWFADRGAQFNASTLAANHVLLQFVSLSAFFLDGFAYVVEMQSGQSIGEKNKKNFIQYIKDSSVIAAITAFILAATFYFTSTWVIPLFSQDAIVQHIALEHIHFASIYILFSFAAFLLDGIFIGATQSRDMRNASVFSFIIFFASSYFMTIYYGNTGLWISFILYVIVRAIGLAYYFPSLVNKHFIK